MDIQWKEHETGLFSCQLPAGWTLEPADPQHDANMILAQDGERSIALVFTPVQRAKNTAARQQEPVESRHAQQQLHNWVTRLHHIRLNDTPHAVPSEGQVICTTEGLEVVRTGVPWWKRLLRMGPRMLWRFWAILNPEVLLLASCNGKPDAIERHRDTVNRIIQSVHLPQHAILTGKRFAQTAMELIREMYPGVTVALPDERHIKVGAKLVELEPIHRGYIHQPDQLRQILRAAVKDLQPRQDTPSSRPPLWSEARQQVLPVLVPESRLHDYGEQIIQQPWVNGLSIIYMMPEPERALTQAQCDRWKVDVDTLHEQSLHNLVARSQELTMEGGKADGYTMLAFAQPDPHNAARILLPDLHHKLREHLGMTFYVAIPNRSFLLAFATDDKDVLARVRQQIHSDHLKLPNPVSAKLFVMTADGVAGEDDDAESA
jgi:hypothetical protein